MENLFTINQVAFILKVHQLTVRRYIREKKLKAIKAGGNVRIKENDLQEFTTTFSPRQTEDTKGLKRSYSKAPEFSSEDPFLRLSGRGASVHLTKK